MQRPGAANIFGFQLRDRTIFLALQMQTCPRYLAQMDFHRFNFFAKASATQGGTNLATSPPRRAISFTMRELRYVYSSFGIRKIVSTLVSSLRFISAI